MSSLVIMIIFIISILLAIPVSISLGIASVLPGAFDPSFTASGQFVDTRQFRVGNFAVAVLLLLRSDTYHSDNSHKQR